MNFIGTLQKIRFCRVKVGSGVILRGVCRGFGTVSTRLQDSGFRIIQKPE